MTPLGGHGLWNDSQVASSNKPSYPDLHLSGLSAQGGPTHPPIIEGGRETYDLRMFSIIGPIATPARENFGKWATN